MDDTALDLGLGEHGAYLLLEPGQAVHAEEQHVLHPAVLQVAQPPIQNFELSLAPTVMLSISLYPSVVTPSTT